MVHIYGHLLKQKTKEEGTRPDGEACRDEEAHPPKEAHLDEETPVNDKNVPKGISNFGNTCYLNSGVQILSASPLAAAYRAQEDHKLPALEGILNISQAERNEDVFQAVTDFKKMFPQYNNNKQHDAGELLSEVMSSTCDQCGLDCPFVKRWCHTIGRNRITCVECGHTRNGGNLMYPVIPLMCSHACTIQDAWDSFVAEEDVYLEDGQDLCDKCGHCDSRYTAAAEVSSSPEFLFIRLNRWREEEVSNRSWMEENLSKNHVPVEIQGVLNVTLPDDIVQEYVLCSLLLHHGTRLTDGHYTCQVMCKDGWVTIDDKTVSRMELDLASPAICGIGYYKGESYRVQKMQPPSEAPKASWKHHLPHVLKHLAAVNNGEIQSKRLSNLLENKSQPIIEGLCRLTDQVTDELDAEVMNEYIVKKGQTPGTMFRFRPEELNLPSHLEHQLGERGISHTKYRIQVLHAEALECLISLMQMESDNV